MNGLSLSLCLAAVAALFASVGQAGAPGYVAVMGVFGYGPAVIKPVALALTVLVAIIGVVRFHRLQMLRWRDLWPFALLGIPFSVLGGLINLPVATYRIVMSIILLGAAVQMALSARKTDALDQRALPQVPLVPAIIAGGLIGLVAGATGIGGGIFTATTMMILGWAPTKRVAAVAQTSNLFTALPAFAAIWIAHPVMPAALPEWALAAGLGGLLGAWLGVKYLPAKVLRTMLAGILLASGIRLALA
jgi:uncharacterized membrane protein YfcA